MARHAAAALVAALLVATAAAFAVTEKLKLTPSPIIGTVVDKIFSPTCDCPTDTARISFVLRRADTVDVSIVDGTRTVVRELARDNVEARGRVSYVWDGRDDSGAIVEEGDYRPRVHLQRQRRTIVMPNPIEVDTTPPHIVSFTAHPTVISPDGDGRHDHVKVRYAYDERVTVELYADGVRALRRLGTQPKGVFTWYGIAGGEPLPEGAYALTLRANDVAGNASRPTRPRHVVIRFIALGRSTLAATPGGPISVLVVTHARRVQWELGEKTGVARRGTLRLHAPRVPGRYALIVTANGHEARANVVVSDTPR